MVRRGKHTVRQITHSAQEHYAAESDESSAPLLPARAGDGWEIPYLNASGEPCVARSRTGLIELRVTLELCFESFEEHTEFSQRFAQFRMDNVHDERQRNWVTAKIDQERVYVCELEEGKRPKCLELPTSTSARAWRWAGFTKCGTIRSPPPSSSTCARRSGRNV